MAKDRRLTKYRRWFLHRVWVYGGQDNPRFTHLVSHRSKGLEKMEPEAEICVSFGWLERKPDPWASAMASKGNRRFLEYRLTKLGLEVIGRGPDDTEQKNTNYWRERAREAERVLAEANNKAAELAKKLGEELEGL